MPSNNKKYSEEMREQTAKHIIESGKSATSMAEELGIDTNTVCRWVRDYRRVNKLPSWAETKGIQPSSPRSKKDLLLRNRELERALKQKEKQFKEEQEKVDILRKIKTKRIILLITLFLVSSSFQVIFFRIKDMENALVVLSVILVAHILLIVIFCLLAGTFKEKKHKFFRVICYFFSGCGMMALIIRVVEYLN